MIKSRANCLLAPVLLLIACDGSGSGAVDAVSGARDTVADFFRAIERADIVQLDDLLRGEAREVFFSSVDESADAIGESGGIGRIDILSEEVYDVQPVRATVVLMRSYMGGYEDGHGYVQPDLCFPVFGYDLVIEDGAYKITDEWDGPDRMYRDEYPREDGAARGTGAAPRSTVVDFIRAYERADSVRLEDLWSWDAYADAYGRTNLFNYIHNLRIGVQLGYPTTIQIDILSEEIYDTEPVRAEVAVMRTLSNGCAVVVGYPLVMEDGGYKIVGPSWDGPNVEWSRGYDGRVGYPDSVARGTDGGPRSAVVDYTRAVERADVAQLDALLSASAETRRALFGNVYNAQRSIPSSFKILSEEVYGRSTVQARVEVVVGSDEEDVVLVFGLVMDDGFWRITTLN